MLCRSRSRTSAADSVYADRLARWTTASTPSSPARGRPRSPRRSSGRRQHRGSDTFTFNPNVRAAAGRRAGRRQLRRDHLQRGEHYGRADCDRGGGASGTALTAPQNPPRAKTRGRRTCSTVPPRSQRDPGTVPSLRPRLRQAAPGSTSAESAARAGNRRKPRDTGDRKHRQFGHLVGTDGRPAPRCSSSITVGPARRTTRQQRRPPARLDRRAGPRRRHRVRRRDLDGGPARPRRPRHGDVGRSAPTSDHAGDVLDDVEHRTSDTLQLQDVLVHGRHRRPRRRQCRRDDL